MNDIISYDAVERRIIEIRGEKVILDSDVAELYGVETKRVNEAVTRNADKFPEGYIIPLTTDELQDLRSQFATTNVNNLLRAQNEVLNEGDNLRSQFVTANVNNLLRAQNAVLNENEKITAKSSSMSRVPPKAFTEKGLYMLATILKSPVATQTTIAIVETFTKLRELSGVINELPDAKGKEQQNGLLRKTGKILGELLDSNALEVLGDETSMELNLALVNIKHTVKRGKRKQE